jgi:hypothetical protein
MGIYTFTHSLFLVLSAATLLELHVTVRCISNMSIRILSDASDRPQLDVAHMHNLHFTPHNPPKDSYIGHLHVHLYM